MAQSNRKPFIVLLIIALVVGAGIGGIFAGGVALGKSSGEDTPASLFPGGPSANSMGGAEPGGPGQFGRGQGGQVPSGLSPRSEGQFDLSGVDRQSPGLSSGDPAMPSFPGRGGVSGTLEKVEVNVATITTAEGPVEVILGEDTSISRISQATVDDLQPGMQLTVMGPAGEGGRVEAVSVVISPEEMESTPGRGQRGGQGFRGGTAGP
jgi:hypothetical protein